MRPPRVEVLHAAGSAAEFHQRAVPSPARRALWWFEVDRPTLVLGSTQSLDLVDHEAAASEGVEVVRRRSGGGAVWLAPGMATWVDVILPAADPRWVDDVGRSALWLGDAWVRALERLGCRGLAVHRTGLVRSPWSGLVCFAGLAPGEVTVGDAKVVGISQRRTRAGARFQCAVVHRWDPVPLLDLVVPDREARAAAVRNLRDCAAGVGDLTPASVVAALLAELRQLD